MNIKNYVEQLIEQLGFIQNGISIGFENDSYWEAIELLNNLLKEMLTQGEEQLLEYDFEMLKEKFLSVLKVDEASIAYNRVYEIFDEIFEYKLKLMNPLLELERVESISYNDVPSESYFDPSLYTSMLPYDDTTSIFFDEEYMPQLSYYDDGNTELIQEQPSSVVAQQEEKVVEYDLNINKKPTPFNFKRLNQFKKKLEKQSEYNKDWVYLYEEHRLLCNYYRTLLKNLNDEFKKNDKTITLLFYSDRNSFLDYLVDKFYQFKLEQKRDNINKNDVNIEESYESLSEIKRSFNPEVDSEFEKWKLKQQTHEEIYQRSVYQYGDSRLNHDQRNYRALNSELSRQEREFERNDFDKSDEEVWYQIQDRIVQNDFLGFIVSERYKHLLRKSGRLQKGYEKYIENEQRHKDKIRPRIIKILERLKKEFEARNAQIQRDIELITKICSYLDNALIHLSKFTPGTSHTI